MKLAVELTSRILISWPSRWYRSKVNGYLQLVITLIWLNPHHQQLSKKNRRNPRLHHPGNSAAVRRLKLSLINAWSMPRIMKYWDYKEKLHVNPVNPYENQETSSAEDGKPSRMARTIRNFSWVVHLSATECFAGMLFVMKLPQLHVVLLFV